MPNKEIIFFFRLCVCFLSFEFIVFCFVLRRMWFLTWSVALFHSSRHLIVYWQLVAHASLFIAQCNKLPTNNRFMHLRKTAVVLFSSFFRALYCYAVSRKTISISKFWKKNAWKERLKCVLLFTLWTLILFVLNSCSIDNESILNIQMLMFFIWFPMFSLKKREKSILLLWSR